MSKIKKNSKRMPCRKRYKIEKKVREHNRKKRKEAKLSTNKKPKLIYVPNECPFKENIIRHAEALKQKKEEERKKHHEEAKERKKELKELKKSGAIPDVQTENKAKDKITSLPVASESKDSRGIIPNEVNFGIPHFRDCKKVLDLADVILEVLDARDPLGTRCKEVQELVVKHNKKLLIILNKADLVQKENLEMWIEYFQKNFPTVPFRSVTYQERQKQKSKKKKVLVNQDAVSGKSIGQDFVLSFLKNYCKNKKEKKCITLSVVGLPNVGKSSVINSLKQSKVCKVGSNPGVTKAVNTIQLEQNIKILDSPGIPFDELKDKNLSTEIILKNVVATELIQDFFNPVTEILKAAGNDRLTDYYEVVDFKTNKEFFEKLSLRQGRFKKGGAPNILAAARIVLDNWNTGKIRYHTLPPENGDQSLPAETVSKMAKDFEVEKLVEENEKTMNEISTLNPKMKIDSFIVKSSGSVSARLLIEQEQKKKKEQVEKRKLETTEPKTSPKRTKKESKEVVSESKAQNESKEPKTKSKRTKKESKEVVSESKAQNESKEPKTKPKRTKKESKKILSETNIEKESDDYCFETDFVLNT